jgi:hypothetical protein
MQHAKEREQERLKLMKDLDEARDASLTTQGQLNAASTQLKYTGEHHARKYTALHARIHQRCDTKMLSSDRTKQHPDTKMLSPELFG